MVLILGAAGAAVAGTNVLAPGAEGAEGRLKLMLAPPKLALALKPPGVDGAGGVDGLGLIVGALLAASSALARRSLSLPANMIPLKVPVKNVAMGMISSKNF